ncbi:MAG: KUP/HAK/KT family potassium transporter, partial [Alphaproteobacteria bacterium]
MMTATTRAAKPGTLNLTLLALGVVYGDIGTSPIYTIGLFFGEGAAFGPNPFDVLGVLSLIFWTLTIVVTVKYVGLILSIDNRGEGGVLALLALALRGTRDRPRRARIVTTIGLLGVALFFADGAVTPAISVLSAVEGLEVAAPNVAPFVVPLAAVILLALFALQSRGTAKIGVVFGPVILVWFVVLAILGFRMIVVEPGVLAAIDPRHALDFLGHHGPAAYLGLGFVFLAVTGAEAMYADLGHFGRTPVRLGWLAVVYPALVLNYFGQGALILSRPEAAAHPFFLLAPDWALYPMIGLTTLATIIASQAVISGASSIGRQAVQLGYLPRLRILHTSASMAGQIFVPRINLIMLVTTLTLVFWFGSSSAIASAYGVAVAGTMVVDVLLATRVYVHGRRLPMPVVFGLFGILLIVDTIFLTASLTKIASGAF